MFMMFLTASLIDAVVDSGITVDSDLYGLGSAMIISLLKVHSCALLHTVKLSAWRLFPL